MQTLLPWLGGKGGGIMCEYFLQLLKKDPQVIAIAIACWGSGEVTSKQFWEG
jgi:hypothetical protein